MSHCNLMLNVQIEVRQERIAVGLKLPRWLVEWLRAQPESLTGLTFEWVLANTWLYDEKTIAWAESQAAQRAAWDADDLMTPNEQSSPAAEGSPRGARG